MNTKIFKRALCVLLSVTAIAMTAMLTTGCRGGENTSSLENETQPAPDNPSTDDEITASNYLESIGIDTATLGIEPNIIHDDNSVGFQLDPPQKGDTIAVLHTTMGDITMRFFPIQAPKAVTNFINLAKDGKYDGTLFSKVIKDSMINGGYCGTSSYGTAFEDEFCDKLFNIRGAVAMVNTSSDNNESAFFINQKNAEAFEVEGGWASLEKQWSEIKNQLASYKDSNLLTAFVEKNGTNCYDTDTVPKEVRELYEKNGGNAYLDGAYNAVDRGCTVFAQVTDGMDVVDKIASAKVDDDDIPTENIIIKNVEITTVK